MAGDFTVEVPIQFEGADQLDDAARDMGKTFVDQIKGMTDTLFGGGAAGGAADSGNRQTISLLKSIALSVGAVALIWQGLEPILRPVLQLMRLFFTVLFIPLMPHIKDIAEKIKEMAQEIREGQQGAGGTGTGAFLGGISAFIPDEFLTQAGILLGAAFLGALTGSKIVGAITAGIGLSFLFDAFGADTISDALKGAVGAAMAVGIATLIFGGGAAAAVKLGVITLSIGLSVGLINAAMTEEDWRIALLEIGGGAMVAGIAALIVGGPTAAVIVGLGTLLLGLELKFGFVEKAGEGIRDFIATTKERIRLFSGGAINLKEAIFGQDQLPTDIIFDMNTGIAGTREEIERLKKTSDESIIPKNQTIMTLGSNIGDLENNESVISNLTSASNEWVAMRDTSLNATNDIINKLNQIPRRIVTTHVIRTVRENE